MLVTIGRAATRLGTAPGAIPPLNSGTTMRMLLGLLAAQRFTTGIVGDRSLSRRPMGRVIEPLTRMGARIEGIGTDRLRVEGGRRGMCCRDSGRGSSTSWIDRGGAGPHPWCE